MTDYSLAHLTVLSLAPPAMIEVAARTGYRYVGLRLVALNAETPGYPLMRDRALMRETRAQLAATGVEVLDIEFVRFTPDLDVAGLVPVLVAGAELGARHLVTAAYDSDRARLADRFAALCDLAAPFGLGPVLEFFPWTDVPNLRSAAGLVAEAGRPNGGVLVDVLHFARSDSTLGELEQVPASMLPFVHLCDASPLRPATLEGLIHTARAERLPPGEGGLPIRDILHRMPPGLPVALEVPMAALTQAAGPEAVARRAREAAARVLAER